jgi:hypothetical protein
LHGAATVLLSRGWDRAHPAGSSSSIHGGYLMAAKAKAKAKKTTKKPATRAKAKKKKK